ILSGELENRAEWETNLSNGRFAVARLSVMHTLAWPPEDFIANAESLVALADQQSGADPSDGAARLRAVEARLLLAALRERHGGPEDGELLVGEALALLGGAPDPSDSGEPL